MQFRILLIIICLIINTLYIYSQAKPKPAFNLGLRFHYGFLLNHAPDRTNISGAILTQMMGMEANIEWQTLGNKKWHHYYNYPSWGMSLVYYNIKDKEINNKNVAWGDGLAWLIYKNIRIIHSPFFKVNIRLGTGFAHFTKPYNKFTNPENLWVSSPITMALHINLETKYRISNHLNLVLGGTFTHYSIGALKMPNLGVNFPSINVGVIYTPYPEREIYQKDTIEVKVKKNFLHLTAGFGTKVIGDSGTKYFPVYAFSVNYGRRLGKVSKLLAGLDFFRDQSLLDSSNIIKGVDINRIGLFLGHEFMFGRLGFVAGSGLYIYKKTDRDAPFYLKIGLRYHFLKNIFGEIMLKTHYGQADNIQWSLGYTF